MFSELLPLFTELFPLFSLLFASSIIPANFLIVLINSWSSLFTRIEICISSTALRLNSDFFLDNIISNCVFPSSSVIFDTVKLKSLKVFKKLFKVLSDTFLTSNNNGLLLVPFPFKGVTTSISIKSLISFGISNFSSVILSSGILSSGKFSTISFTINLVCNSKALVP